VLRISPFLDTYFYRLNTTRPGLDQQLVRQALAAAVDRRAIVEKVVRGGQRPATAFTPPGLGAYAPPDRLVFAPDRARRLLAEAGFPGGAGLPPVTILINSSGNHRIIAEVVQQMWSALGVSVQIDNMEQSSLFAKRRTLDYSVLRSEWAADFADPKSFLDIFRGGSSNNHTGWHSAAYDQLLQAADHTADPAARAALLQQAETLLLDEAPIIPIYYFTTVRLVHPAVRGWSDLPLDRHPYKHVWLEK
jgi:oligopeptide transport system substrate-binding protein